MTKDATQLPISQPGLVLPWGPASPPPWRASRPTPRTPHPDSPHLPALVPEELPGVLDDLLVRQLGVGLLLAEGERLPQGHPEGPHVARRGELALCRWGREGKVGK